MKNLERTIDELKKENQKNNLEISNLSSPKFLEDSAKSLGMVRAQEIKYLSPTTGVLVVR
jgi:cell division protein FtsL